MSTDAQGQAHDIIQLTRPQLSALSQKIAEMYASGQSQREIARILNSSKSTIQGSLVKLGIPCRSNSRERKSNTHGTFGRKAGFSPYGFMYLEGRLVGNPKELFVVHKIMDLWNSGRNFSSIAKEISRTFSTRKGTKWDHSLISNIIDRVTRKEFPYDQTSVMPKPIPKKIGNKKFKRESKNSINKGESE